MFLTGYHGTSLSGAESIIRSGKFSLSKSKTEWLGPGIYFYFDLQDALDWKDAEAVIHAVIRVADDEYLDLSSEKGKDLCSRTIDCICETLKTKLTGSAQENQCAVAKLIWDLYPGIKVMSCEFPKEPRPFPVLMEYRSLRKEFCLRDNSSIKQLHLFKREDIDA